MGSENNAAQQRFLELAALMQSSLFNRRIYEFRVAFGLWTAIAAWTYFVVAHPQYVVLSASLIWYLVLPVYVVVFTAWLLGWLLPLRSAHEQDRQWKHYYMDMAEGYRGCDRNSRPKGETIQVIGGVPGWQSKYKWIWGHCIVTLVFFLLSFMILLGSPKARHGSSVALPANSGNDSMQWVYLVTNALVGIGTIVLAIVAVWGDPIRRYFVGPRLRLVKLHNQGHLIRGTDGEDRIYYHLKIVNARPSAVVKNATVRLVKIWRMGLDGSWAEIRIPYALIMCWPPSEWTPMATTFTKDALVDFGVLERGRGFTPKARVFPNNFSGIVGGGETIRYGFEISAETFVSKALQVFEVSWTGEWPCETTGQTLVISEV